MFVSLLAKTKGAANQVPPSKPPVKQKAKTPEARTSHYQPGNPGSTLRVITGGKSQGKPAVKNGTVVFADDKIQANPKPAAKPNAAKKAQAKKVIDDFGMIKLAKDSGKDVKRSVWGNPKLPSQPANAKQNQGKR